MQDHPLILKALECYVRKPLEESCIDKAIFAPAKRAWLQRRVREKEREAVACCKLD